MKRIISAILAFILVLATTIQTSAVEFLPNDGELTVSGVFSSAEGKTKFAQKADEAYAEAISDGTAKSADMEIINQLIEESSFATGNELIAIEEELELYGVYRYSEDSVASRTVHVRTNVQLNKPQIYYVTSGQHWYVTFSGCWDVSNWNVGSMTTDVGDEDAYGVYFINTSGAYNSSITSSYCRISEEGGDNPSVVYTRDPVISNSKDGFCFRIQDYYRGGKYIGEEWYCYCIYDSAFGGYSGTAVGFYAHTFASCIIDSFGFNTSTENRGFNVEFSIADEGWTAITNEVRFG